MAGLLPLVLEPPIELSTKCPLELRLSQFPLLRPIIVILEQLLQLVLQFIEHQFEMQPSLRVLLLDKFATIIASSCPRAFHRYIASYHSSSIVD